MLTYVSSRMDVKVSSPDMAESETESMIAHANGDANMDDLLSENECETDVEIETVDGTNSANHNHESDASSLIAEPRAKTRLLSRSHSVNDLNSHPDDISVDNLATDPPRRNSSGEYPSQIFDIPTPTPKPSVNIFLQDIELPKYKNTQQRHSLTPTSSMQLSPVNVQYSSPTGWRNPQPSHQDKEDNFTALLQTTAERVLSRLKSRQQDLGANLNTGQKYQKKVTHSLQPTVPRKLQPITREGSKTPRSDSDMRSTYGDADFGPLSAA